MHNAARDLACPELWADSLARSRARRQQGATRVDLIPGRKGLAVAGAVAATAVPVATAAAAGGGLLQRGDEGGRVRGVQHRLGIGGDGLYGPHTAHAVRMFQKRNGLDVEIKYAVETLKNVYKLWHRPVHLQARIDDEMILFTFDGNQPKQQTIHDDLPKPAHQII